MREYKADIAIIGAGLGGVAAALAALKAGRSVVLTEEYDWIGGQMTSQAVPSDEHSWIEQMGGTRSFRALRTAVRQFYRDHYPLGTIPADAPVVRQYATALAWSKRRFFARLLGRYVRDEKLISLPEAVRRLTSLPAGNLALKERGLLRAGYFADIVVFDPATIQDHATFEKPQQFATGVSHVVVNGGIALSDGEPTGKATGRVVRGQGWKGWPDGGCRASAKDWPARP